LFSERVKAIWNSQNSSRPIGDGIVHRDWFTIENKADSTDVYVFDAIMDGAITAGEFQSEINAIKSKQINLFINSPGGFVADGTAIYNALKQHPATVNVRVMGLAASIASVIAQAGDTIEMSPGSLMMIHEASAITLGTASDHRKSAEVLDTMTAAIAGIYAGRSGKDASHWRALMSAETWFSDQEAVVAGLADSVVGQATTGPTNTVEEPAIPSWQDAARRLVAAAQMEVIHAYAH
jgi:ATP-dependent protease ClpP protease subunit